MPGPLAAGTFATGSVAASGNAGDTLIVPAGTTTMRVTLTGLDASNTVKTQKRAVPSAVFVDQTTYNSDQANVGVTVVANEEWRVIGVTQQAFRDIRFKLSVES